MLLCAKRRTTVRVVKLMVEKFSIANKPAVGGGERPRSVVFSSSAVEEGRERSESKQQAYTVPLYCTRVQ